MTTPEGDKTPSQEPAEDALEAKPAADETQEAGDTTSSEEPAKSTQTGAVVEPSVVTEATPEPDPEELERKRRLKWLIAGGVIVLLLGAAIGVSIWYFTSPQSANSPSEAVRLYMKSIKERDADQASKVLCKEITKGKKLEVSSDYSFDKFNYDVRKPQKINAKEYFVGVDIDAVFSSDGKKTTQKNTQVYRVIKEDGHWKTCGSLGPAAPPGSTQSADQPR